MSPKIFLALCLSYALSFGALGESASAQQCPPHTPLVPAEVKLTPMAPEDLPIMHRMGKFFIYDLSPYMLDHKDWKLPHDGSYECESHPSCKKLDRYVDKAPNHFAFFIYYKNEMAGFVMGSVNSDSENTAEIFIISKFLHQGLGKHIAEMIFKQYPGRWDAQSIGEHHASKATWGYIDPHIPPRTLDKSKVKILLLKPEDASRAQRKARFFLYSELEYMGSNPRWSFPEHGYYELASLEKFFINIGKDAFPYFILYDGELAGFMMIDKNKFYPNTQYAMAEFFVSHKFRGQGLGRYAAEYVFKKHPGIWEVQQMVENCAAIKFWEKVIGKYTKNRYTRALKPIPFLNNRIQVLEQFDSRGK